MKQYLLVKASDEGTGLSWLDEGQLRGLLADPSQWGVDEFLSAIPDSRVAYWRRGVGLLLRVEVLAPVRVSAFVIPNVEEIRPHVTNTDHLKATWVTGHGLLQVEDVDLPDDLTK